MGKYWGMNCCAFALEEAVRRMVELAGPHPIWLDIDRLLASAGSSDISDLTYSLVLDDTLLSRSSVFRSTLGFGFDDGVRMPTDYTNCGPLDSDFLLKRLEYPALPRLAYLRLSLTRMIPGLPLIRATNAPTRMNTLKKVTFDGISVRDFDDESGRKYYIAEYTALENVYASLDQLLDMLRSCPNLETLNIHRVRFQKLYQYEEPVEIKANINVVSGDLVSIRLLRDFIRTTGSWRQVIFDSTRPTHLSKDYSCSQKLDM